MTGRSSCLPNPVKQNGSSLIRNRVSSTRMVRTPTLLVVAVDQVAAEVELELEVVQVAVAGRPRVHVWQREGAREAVVAGHLPPFSVAEHGPHTRAVGTGHRGRVVNGSGVAVEVGDHGDVGDV